MPALATSFETSVNSAVALARAGEIARAEAPTNTDTYREFRPSRLEALYELAYIRTFIAWEQFMEGSFIRMMCDYQSPIWSPVYPEGISAHPTLATAKSALYSGAEYLLWWNPTKVMARSQKWFDHGPHETVVAANFARLEWFAAARHRIAHGSHQVREELDKATMGLAGRRYPGSSAGRFLRDWKPDSQPRERWLATIATELIGLAKQIAP